MRSVFPVLTLTGLLGAAAMAGGSPWQAFHSRDGAFRVLLPGKPQMAVTPIAGIPDAPALHLYQSKDGQVPYVALFLHLPHDVALNLDDRMLLDMSEQRLNSSGKFHVLFSKPFTVEGLRGREMKVRQDNGSVGVIRVLFAGDYYYCWATQSNPYGKSNPRLAQFMASFRPDPQVMRAAHQLQQEQKDVARLLEAKQASGGGSWKELSLSRAGLSVEMPGFLRYGKSKVKDPDTPGRTINIYRVTAPASPTQREVYITAYAEGDTLRLNESADRWLDEFRNEASSRRGMRLTSSQDITVNGYPGREYRYDDGAGFSEMTRVVLADSRLYILTAIAPVERSYSDETMRFLRSFKLSGAAKAPTKTQRLPAVRRDTL